MNNRQMMLEHTDRVEDLVFTPLEPQFIKAQFVTTLLVYLVLMGLSLLILLIDSYDHRYLATLILESCLLVAMIINLCLLPKAYRFKGFAIREHDITYRTGIFFPKTLTIPFCKIQQVSTSQNPITRFLGLYAVDIVNGAQLLSSLRIPGLSETTALAIKSHVIQTVKDENH